MSRAEKTAIAQMLDRDEWLAARIEAQAHDTDPGKRVRLAVEFQT